MAASAIIAASVGATLLTLSATTSVSVSNGATAISAPASSISTEVSRSYQRQTSQATAITTSSDTENDYVDVEGYSDFPSESLKLAQAYDAQQQQIKEAAEKAAAVASANLFTLAQFKSAGVVNWGDHKFTYYSQSVLPGGGLNIPGRHVTDAGYVCDADGYIVLAGSAALGTVYETPFGAKGKVYDRGVSGNHLDVYIR
jgi:hypothetical protein